MDVEPAPSDYKKWRDKSIWSSRILPRLSTIIVSLIPSADLQMFLYQVGTMCEWTMPTGLFEYRLAEWNIDEVVL